MNVVAGRMRNTTLGTNELILCSVVKSLFLLNMSAFKTMGTSEEKPASSTQDIPPHTVSRLAYYGGGGTPNPFFPSKDQAIFVGVKLAIIQRCLMRMHFRDTMYVKQGIQTIIS
ncbi:unnamed protein product [Brassica napus]|uniref:(rape) hypothetical protein n=1 Tax=Brassica napus TaxID=3708 RepID=A0A816K1S3_BRANA|nr:unnamed protein product [Brassica napus]